MVPCYNYHGIMFVFPVKLTLLLRIVTSCDPNRLFGILNVYNRTPIVLNSNIIVEAIAVYSRPILEIDHTNRTKLID